MLNGELNLVNRILKAFENYLMYKMDYNFVVSKSLKRQ